MSYHLAEGGEHGSFNRCSLAAAVLRGGFAAGLPTDVEAVNNNNVRSGSIEANPGSPAWVTRHFVQRRRGRAWRAGPSGTTWCSWRAAGRSSCSGSWPAPAPWSASATRCLHCSRFYIFMLPNVCWSLEFGVLETPAPAPWSASAIKCVVHAQMRCRIVGRDFQPRMLPRVHPSIARSCCLSPRTHSICDATAGAGRSPRALPIACITCSGHHPNL